MATIVSTVAYLGLEARAVEVQVQLIAGLPAFNLVGLADKAVGESRERVRAAIAASSTVGDDEMKWPAWRSPTATASSPHSSARTACSTVSADRSAGDTWRPVTGSGR